ncbi:MAG: histidinol-phosphate transaminase [Proteocatella sp.]
MSKKHGANLFELSKKYNFNIDEILDFSSNINPFGANSKAVEYVRNHMDIVSIYPDPEYINLKNSISLYCNCKREDIMLGNGATSLISNYIKYISPEKSLLIQPAYSEYENELNDVGSQIERFFLDKNNDFKIDKQEIVNFINGNDIDLLIICNPNNPTGTILSKNEIEYISKNISANILIDETYIEFSDKEVYSATSLTTANSNIFVIRGTSKFFSTPGIRLGYAITSDIEAQKFINSKFHLWDINIVASTMGEIMFSDKDYIQDTYAKISTEMTYLKNSLSSFESIKAYPSSGNFILCEILDKNFDAVDIYNELIKKGIAIRNCSSFTGLDNTFFRICTLSHSSNELLIEELGNILNKNE